MKVPFEALDHGDGWHVVDGDGALVWPCGGVAGHGIDRMNVSGQLAEGIARLLNRAVADALTLAGGEAT